MFTLFPPQQRSHDILVAAMRTHGAALDSSITGSGKTLKSVEIARTLGMKPVVVCPKIVVPAWRDAFAGQGVEYLDVLTYEKIRNGSTQWLSKVGKTFQWNLPPGTMLIFDEVHRCKAVRGKNVLMLVTAKRQYIPCLMLSATAAEDPSEMRAIGFAVGLHKDVDFTRWAIKWGCTFDPWKNLTFPVRARPRLIELHDEIYPSRGHKISRAEMGDYFTETSIIVDPIDFGDEGKMAELFNEMQAELDSLAEISGSNAGASALTARLRARQQIELLRVPVLAEMIEECVKDEKCSAAVFLNFRASMDALAERIGHLCPGQIHGDQNKVERAEAIERFQADLDHVIICQLAAGGAGVSLHDVRGVRPRRSFISPCDDAKIMVQALGRIDRAGAVSDTVQRMLFAAGTVEEEVAKNFRKKIKNMETLHKDIDEGAEPEVESAQMPSPQPENGVPPQCSNVHDGDCVAKADTAEAPAHAKHSPSKLKYLELCPGYESREGPVNPAAEMGTRLHAALETGDMNMVSNGYEMLIVERCQDALMQILEVHGWSATSFKEFKEIRLQIALPGGHDTFGTCDLLMINGREGIMVDWKTGKGAIDDAEINTQAQAYTLGAFQRFTDLDRIHFYFVIPQRDEVTFHTYERSDCDRISLRLHTIIERTEQFQKEWKGGREVPFEMFNPQPNLCEFCRNQWKCHAVQKKVFDIAKKYAPDGLPVPDKVHGSETDDPEAIAAMLKLKPVVEQWLEGVASRAKRMAFEEGVDIPGFEAKEKNGRKSISSALAAWNAFSEVTPEATVEDFLASLGSIPFNTVADVIYNAAGRGKKTAAKNAFEDKLDEMGVLERQAPSQYLAVVR